MQYRQMESSEGSSGAVRVPLPNDDPTTPSTAFRTGLLLSPMIVEFRVDPMGGDLRIDIDQVLVPTGAAHRNDLQTGVSMVLQARYYQHRTRGMIWNTAQLTSAFSSAMTKSRASRISSKTTTINSLRSPSVSPASASTFTV
jgi:hypothetical protein